MEKFSLNGLAADKKKKVTKVVSQEKADIMNIQMTAGEEIPEHQSPDPVIIVILKGKVLFEVNNVEHELSASDIITFESRELHSVRAIEDCSILLIRQK